MPRRGSPSPQRKPLRKVRMNYLLLTQGPIGDEPGRSTAALTRRMPAGSVAMAIFGRARRSLWLGPALGSASPTCHKAR
jgi:hypothetical protein